MDKRKLIAKIDGIGKRAKTLSVDIQIIGLEAAEYMIDPARGNGDSGMLTRLYTKINTETGLNAKAFSLWCETFFAVRLHKDVFRKDKTKEVDIEGAKSVNWWTYRSEVEKPDYTMKSLAQALARLEKKIIEELETDAETRGKMLDDLRKVKAEAEQHIQ